MLPKVGLSCLYHSFYCHQILILCLSSRSPPSSSSPKMKPSKNMPIKITGCIKLVMAGFRVGGDKREKIELKKMSQMAIRFNIYSRRNVTLTSCYRSSETNQNNMQILVSDELVNQQSRYRRRIIAGTVSS